MSAKSGRCWRSDSNPVHGSARKRVRRSGTVRSVNFAGSNLRSRSPHAIGVATVAPSRARGLNEAIAVAPNPLRSQSIKILPSRSAFLTVDRNRSGCSWLSVSANALTPRWRDDVADVVGEIIYVGVLTEVKLTEGKEIKEGDEVREGELLFRIDHREYDVAVKRAEADLLKANAELKKLEALTGPELTAFNKMIRDENVPAVQAPAVLPSLFAMMKKCRTGETF